MTDEKIKPERTKIAETESAPVAGAETETRAAPEAGAEPEAGVASGTGIVPDTNAASELDTETESASSPVSSPAPPPAPPPVPEVLAFLPRTPGVYLMKDRDDRVIYVGKAIDLKARVSSYFHQHMAARQQVMRAKIHDVEYITTGSEGEALVLEARLIKEYLPRYNVNLKDDKSYPYLRVTAEPYPSLEMVRLPDKKSTDGKLVYQGIQPRYFGPFTGAGALRQTMKILGRIFPLRTCRQPLDGTPRGRPCLNHQMKRCLAPCQGEEFLSPEHYQTMVQQVILFLEGKREDLGKKLQTEMTAAARRLEFEKAAALRDRLQQLQATSAARKITGMSTVGRDVLALVKPANSRQCAVHMLKLREGRLDWRELFFLGGTAGLAEDEIMAGFIKNYYSRGSEPPPEIILSETPPDHELLEKWLTGLAGRRVCFFYPKRGERKELLERALREGELLAGEQAVRRNRYQKDQEEEWQKALHELVLHTGCREDLERIEGYDISHLRGGQAVGAMVVFLRGLPFKDGYRRFRIRAELQGDDIGALKEVFRRRFAHREFPLPGLVLVDGGPAQLVALEQVLREKELELPVLSLAKKNEEIYLPGKSVPVNLPETSPALQQLQRVRDEAHRFALSYHRNLREKGVSTSLLDTAPGIGRKRKQQLLEHFGSMDAILQATMEQLTAAPGFSRVMAQKVHDYLHR